MVYFVGAGPGHPGLITVRGVECLRKADVVMYDYLANARILCHARADAELICLGRHRRSDVWSQEAINQEMVDRAARGQIVARLKGGDPMIFGRAAEELGALVYGKIPFEIVPGITAASAAGAYAGITITDREHASAVALVTGHERLGKPSSSLDYQSLANFPGTLVVYMGVRTAESWSEALLSAGKSADTPVTMIRRCSWPDQRRISCTLGEVATELSPYQKFPPPVLVVIGEAARANPDFDWFQHLPLVGKGVLVTRPTHQSESMVSRLSELGANAILQPAIEIQPPSSWQPVDDVIQRLDEFDCLVFSSANGVRFFFDRLLSSDKDVRDLGRAKLAVVGPRTALELETYSLKPDIQPSTYRAEALASALTENSEVKGQRFLLLRASRGREVLAEQLTTAGAQVEQAVVYQSEDVTELNVETQERIDANEISWVTVTSSAIARSVVKLLGDRGPQLKWASISPITSQTLRDCGIEPAVEATEYTVDGVIDAILREETK